MLAYRSLGGAGERAQPAIVAIPQFLYPPVKEKLPPVLRQERSKTYSIEREVIDPQTPDWLTVSFIYCEYSL
jgi:hypothetical protein